MKFTTTIITVATLLVATVSAAPTPQFGGSIEDRQFGDGTKVGDKRAAQFGGQIQDDKKHKLDGALFSPSVPAKPIVERQIGGETDKRQFGGSVEDRQWSVSSH
ncbi:hypothetical protein SLS60_005245 [Paraconiothyrium brasiliense]|uniref:Uncharacterized protein n=1 Tax=Paraconiothyrium brasiliense TaxID=300254 RepID=A0ABR3RID1_9PLEO